MSVTAAVCELDTISSHMKPLKMCRVMSYCQTYLLYVYQSV